MCKYCEDLGYDDDFDMFVNVVSNKTTEICLISEKRGHFLEVTNKMNNDDSMPTESSTSVKIEYCPFCGQKLSDIKVENDNE